MIYYQTPILHVLYRLKANLGNFLSSKWIVKEWRQPQHNKHICTGTANEQAVGWCFNQLCKGGESSKMRSTVVIPKVDNDQLRATAKANPLSVTQRSVRTILALKQTGKVKSLPNGCLIKWPKQGKEKLTISIHCPLSLWNKNEAFLSRIVTCDEKWTAHDNCDGQFSICTEKL